MSNPVNHGKPWLQSETEDLLVRFRSGQAPQEIADALGRKANAVIGRLTHLGHLTIVGKAYHKVEADPWVTFEEIRSMK